MDNGNLYRPRRKTEWRVLLSRDTGYRTYYAFPTLLEAGEEALICVKTGEKHWGDGHASLSVARIDTAGQTLKDVRTVFEKDGFTPQQGEIVRMPNGDVCIYIDMQQSGSNRRTGMWELRSFDGGYSFPVQKRVGIIDGIEYGYPLSMTEKNGRVYMLVMAFDNLAGERFREVHVISSADSGESWRFEANLRGVIGVPFNESCILPCGEGFLIMTRGERDRRGETDAEAEFDSAQCLAVTDEHFHLLRMRDLRHETDFFSLTGRPRLYRMNGEICLFTRQQHRAADGRRMMTMDLFRIDPATLEVLARVRLDEPRFYGQDGHYPTAYTADGKLHAVTYLSCAQDECGEGSMKCDLVQLSFDLNEIFSFGGEVR